MKNREKDIIDEIHERRIAIMARFDNNLEKYCEYLREREKQHPERMVDQITIVRGDKPRPSPQK